MSLRLAFILALLPIVIFGTLRRPYWGLVAIILIYFIRPEIWGAPEALKPTYILTWVTMVAWFIHWLKDKKPVAMPKNFKLALALLICMIISSLFAVVSSEVSYAHNIKILKLIIVMFLIINLVDTPQKMKIMLWTITLGVGYLVKNAVFLYHTLHPLRVDNVGGQASGANYLGEMVVITLPFLIYTLSMSPFNFKEKLVSLLFIPLWIYSLVLSVSRGAFIAFICISIAILLDSTRKKRLLVVAILVIAGLVALAPPYFWERMSSVFYYKEEASALKRTYLWQVGWQMFKDHPLTGVGQDNFPLRSFSYLGPLLVNLHPSLLPIRTPELVAHNLYIQTLAETGLQGLVFLVLLLWVSYRQLNPLARAYSYEKGPLLLSNFAKSIRLSLVAFTIASIFSSSIYTDVWWWIVGLSGALVIIAKKEQALPNQARIESPGSVEIFPKVYAYLKREG